MQKERKTEEQTVRQIHQKDRLRDTSSLHTEKQTQQTARQTDRQPLLSHSQLVEHTDSQWEGRVILDVGWYICAALRPCFIQYVSRHGGSLLSRCSRLTTQPMKPATTNALI